MAHSLFSRFLSEDNFALAFDKVVAKGAAGGIDGLGVDDFRKNAEQRLKRLRREVEEGRYVPEPTAGVSIPKHDGKNGRRQLGLPTVADKIVQMALNQVVAPRAEKMFHNTSYGYRPEKGPQRALRRVEHNLVSGKQTWVVHRDVDNFFDSLDHGRLLQLFAQLVEGDERLVELVALWCRGGIVARDGRWRNVSAGVRQGQVISPLLANLYLHALDEYAEANGWGWVRYADDFLLQCRDREQAAAANLMVAGYLKETLRLGLNDQEQPVADLAEGFIFLGVEFKGDQRRIAAKKITKMKSRLNDLLAPGNGAAPEIVFGKLQLMLDGWRRYYGHLNPLEQFAEIDGHARTRLEALVARQIGKGAWPAAVPQGLRLPCLSGEGQTSRDKLLKDIWRKPAAAPKAADLDVLREKCDRKVGKRRRRHQRDEVRGGDIWVVSPGHFVGKRGGRILVREKQKVVAEVPGERVQAITLAAKGLGISADVIRYCSERDIPLHFTDEQGRIIAMLQKPGSRRNDIALLQALHQDDAKGLHLARMFIYGKVKNQLSLLKYYSKYKRAGREAFLAAFADEHEGLKKLVAKIKALEGSTPKDFRNSLMGLEGAFAARYWKIAAALLPEKYPFEGRFRQGATDIVNAALNYGYGILYARILTALIRAGLNPSSGFLHAPISGKPILSWDLIEVFRAPVVDRAVFSMLNRRVDVALGKDGTLAESARKQIAQVVLARLGSTEVWQNRQDTLQNHMERQAQAIVEHLRENISFRPFLSRW